MKLFTISTKLLVFWLLKEITVRFEKQSSMMHKTKQANHHSPKHRIVFKLKFSDIQYNIYFLNQNAELTLVD